MTSVLDTYANKLGFDISCQVGISQYLKVEAKELLDQGGINKATYDKLLKLELSGKDGKAAVKDKNEGK